MALRRVARWILHRQCRVTNAASPKPTIAMLGKPSIASSLIFWLRETQFACQMEEIGTSRVYQFLTEEV
jgi:hypothetical protein